jgi:hypothetical protein
MFLIKVFLQKFGIEIFKMSFSSEATKSQISVLIEKSDLAILYYLKVETDEIDLDTHDIYEYEENNAEKSHLLFLVEENDNSEDRARKRQLVSIQNLLIII